MTFSLPACRAEAVGLSDDLGTPLPEVSEWIDVDPAHTQAALETLRAWTKRLAAPGVWWPEAPRIVAPALVSLDGWKGDALRVDTAMGRDLYDKDAGRAWRSGPRSIVTVCHDAKHDRWRPGGVHGDRRLRRQDGDRGDSFFQAVLQALPENGSALGVHGRPIALRQAVVTCLENVLGRWERTPGEPLWLRGVLREWPTCQAPATTSARAMGASRKGGSDFRPAVTRPQTRTPAENQIQLALACNRKGDFRGACLQLEGVHPRKLVPLSLLRALCAKPFETDDPGLLERMALMLERLATPPNDLFLPGMGLSPDGGELDFHLERILVHFPPGHLNEWEEGGALSGGMARVLFQLHLQRRAINTKTKFVVGEHGTNALHKAIDASIAAQGWESRLALWSNTKRATSGVLAIWTGDEQASPKDLVYRETGASRAMKLDQGLKALNNASDSSRILQSALWRMRDIHQVDEVRTVLDMLEEHRQLPQPLPRRLHEQLATQCARFSSWEALEVVLPVLKVLHGGALPREVWCRLMLRAGDVNGAWQAARKVYELRCREEACLPSDEELEALFSRIIKCPELNEAEKLYRSLHAVGLPASVKALNVLLRKSSLLGVDRHVATFRTALRRLGSEGGSESLRSALIHTCLRHPERVSADLSALRERGVLLDRDAMRSVVRAYMVRDDARAAAAEIRQSITRGDNVYQPTLGLVVRDDDGPVRIEIGDATVYVHVRSLLESQKRCSMYEALAILHLHFLEGRLTEGCELRVMQVTDAVKAKQLRDYLATLRLAQEPVRSREGIGTSFSRVVALGAPSH